MAGNACERMQRDVLGIIQRLDGQAGQVKSLSGLVGSVEKMIAGLRTEVGAWVAADGRAVQEILDDLQALEADQTIGELQVLLLELWAAYRSPVVAGMIGTASLSGELPVAWRFLYVLLALIADPITGAYFVLLWVVQLSWGIIHCKLTWGPWFGLPDFLKPVVGAPGLGSRLLFDHNASAARRAFLQLFALVQGIAHQPMRQPQLVVGADDSTVAEDRDTANNADTADTELIDMDLTLTPVRVRPEPPSNCTIPGCGEWSARGNPRDADLSTGQPDIERGWAFESSPFACPFSRTLRAPDKTPDAVHAEKEREASAGASRRRQAP